MLLRQALTLPPQDMVPPSLFDSQTFFVVAPILIVDKQRTWCVVIAQSSLVTIFEVCVVGADER